MKRNPQIMVVDLGGQYCHLIARRLREMGIYTEIKGPNITLEETTSVKGLILSGSPRSVYAAGSPFVSRRVIEAGIPILGICYGHQLLAHLLGGMVAPGSVKEYGRAVFTIEYRDGILSGLDDPQQVWMSHGDEVKAVPRGFVVLGSTKDCTVAAMADLKRKIYGVQFHPEVTQTPSGDRILHNFAFSVCRTVCDWDPAAEIEILSERLRRQVLDKRVFFLVSGGVDSTVAFVLCSKALGEDKVTGLYIDTGYMRKGERLLFARHCRAWA